MVGGDEEGAGHEGACASFHEEELFLGVGGVGFANVFDVEDPVAEGVVVDVVIVVVIVVIVAVVGSGGGGVEA